MSNSLSQIHTKNLQHRLFSTTNEFLLHSWIYFLKSGEKIFKSENIKNFQWSKFFTILHYFLFSTYHLTYCVFSTRTTTLRPKIALSTSHPLHRDKGSWKGVKGVRISPRQCGRFCQRVACSHFSASTAPPNESATTTLYQSDAVFLWPRKLPGAQVTVRDRQTDHTACLLIIIQPCLTLSPPSSFSCSSFLTPTSLSEGPLTPITFLVNNTGALWKDEWWQSGRKAGWRNSGSVKRRRRISSLSRSEWALKPDWMSWQKTDRWSEQRRLERTYTVFKSKGKERTEWRIRHQCIVACTDIMRLAAVLVAVLGGCSFFFFIM